MFSCVVSRESTVRPMESGAQRDALGWTPLGGVDGLSHGSTVVPDPVGTRRWSCPTASCPQFVSAPSAVDACGVAPVSAPSVSFSFSSPVASATYPSAPFGSYMPPVMPVRANLDPMCSSGRGVGHMQHAGVVPWQFSLWECPHGLPTHSPSTLTSRARACTGQTR